MYVLQQNHEIRITPRPALQTSPAMNGNPSFNPSSRRRLDLVFPVQHRRRQQLQRHNQVTALAPIAPGRRFLLP